MAYRVTAPYVLLKVKDPVTGAFTFQGLYEGAVVQDVEPDNLRHHLDLEMVEEVPGQAAASLAEADREGDHPSTKNRRT